jgi:hypothetical protein
MSEQIALEQQSGPKTRWSKALAISVMTGGGALILIPWFITAPEDSALHIVKVVVGLLGFVTLCIGAYKRP